MLAQRFGLASEPIGQWLNDLEQAHYANRPNAAVWRSLQRRLRRLPWAKLRQNKPHRT